MGVRSLAYERMRGIYLDGAVLDEYPLLHPNAFTSVVRPCLADYRGFRNCIRHCCGRRSLPRLEAEGGGRSRLGGFRDPGHKRRATVRFLPDEVEEMRNDMSEDEFAREDVHVRSRRRSRGAYYQEAINALQLQNRVTRVAVDLNASVATAWDLGIKHLQVVWLFQICGREVCTGSIILRAVARSLVTTSTFSGSRRRPAASATRRTCCHMT